MLSVGALIWISVRPLLRLVLCTSTGYIITKADIFPAVAARGTGQILLNILMPCLMFSKIVPSFTSENISALGPLILVASIYEILGVVIAWLVKQFFWVPHRFRYGVLVAGGWSNVGDVPTAVILSITGSAPFNGTSDQNVAVAYISVFILVFFVSLFPMGGHRLIELDYVGPEVDDEDVRMSMIAKTKQSIRHWTHSTSSVRRVVSSEKKRVEDLEAAPDEKSEKIQDSNVDVSPTSAKEEIGEVELTVPELAGTTPPDAMRSHVHMRLVPHKHVSFGFAEDTATAVPTEPFSSRVCSPAHTEVGPSCNPSRVTSPAPSVTHIDGDGPSSSRFQRAGPMVSVPESVGPSTMVQPRSKAIHHRLFAYARTFAVSLLTVQAITIFVAFPIALVTPLKGLFTAVNNSLIPNAPDGNPPLAFILDTATFIGNASVPIGLICLGSALARLNVPRSQWKYLPWGAISWLAIGKMIVMPILGILITQGLVHAGIIGEEQRVLRFVCMFLSCIPTATTQVYLTQVYSGTGSADTLSAFLIPQYALMFVTMTVLCAYSLQLIY